MRYNLSWQTADRQCSVLEPVTHCYATGRRQNTINIHITVTLTEIGVTKEFCKLILRSRH